MSRLYVGFKSKVLSHIIDEFPSKILVQSDNVENFVKSYSKFFDHDKIFMHCNPDNEDLKVISSFIDKKLSMHFLYYDDDNYDGRSSLIQKIKKINSIYDFSFPVVGDSSNLHRFIKSYVTSKNCMIDYDCLVWLNENCPILRSKIKGTKKEKLCYDLEILTQELDKITSITQNIKIENFESSSFNSDSDIFLFFEFLLNGEINKSIELCKKLSNTIGEHTVLMVLIYHIIFLLELSGLREKGFKTADKIIPELELRNILGKYLNENWQEPDFNIKAQNPIRINIELSKKNINTKSLSMIFQTVYNTIIDLRNNGVFDNTMNYMIYNIAKALR